MTPGAALVAGVVVLLAHDPELRAMADANDAERFAEGCRNPAFDRKVAGALVAFREAVSS